MTRFLFFSRWIARVSLLAVLLIATPAFGWPPGFPFPRPPLPHPALPPDLGSYFELVVEYDDENVVARAYAIRCDREAPTRWE